MKNTITILFLLLCTSFSKINAKQGNWLLGLRSGIRYDNYFSGRGYAERSLAMDNGMFVQRKIFKRFSLELGASFLQKKNASVLYFWDGRGNTRFDGTLKANLSMIIINTGVIYNIIRKKKLDIYISGGITNYNGWSSSKVQNNGIQSEYESEKHTNRTIHSVYTGTGAVYSVSKNLFINLNSRFEILINGQEYNGVLSNNPFITPTVQLGFGWRF